MSLNKEKVNEILADMKEEERKKQEAIEAEVDKFLEVRLEYYVAMVINGMVYDEISLLHTLNNDGCNLLFEAKDKINEALEEFNWYLCLKGRHDLDLHYMHISDAKNDIPQPTNVENRQIELGVRPDRIDEIRNMFEGMKDKLENNREFHEKWNQVSNEKQKKTNNRLKILAYFLIVISITLFAFLK